MIILGLTLPDKIVPFRVPFSPPGVHVLVSYVYHETPRHSPCEILNKRVNLAFFFRQAVARSGGNVKFLFSHPNNFPDAKDLLRLLVDVTHEEEKFVTRALQGKFSHIQMLNPQQVAPDICHHQHAIRDELKRNKKIKYDFYMVLNDGVRGPFMNHESTAQVRYLVTYAFQLGFYGSPLTTSPFRRQGTQSSHIQTFLCGSKFTSACLFMPRTFPSLAR